MSSRRALPSHCAGLHSSVAVLGRRQNRSSQGRAVSPGFRPLCPLEHPWDGLNPVSSPKIGDQNACYLMAVSWTCACVPSCSVVPASLRAPWTICSPLGSSVHGTFQARILEWVAMPPSRGSSQPRDWTHVSYISCISRQVLHHCATWEVWTWAYGLVKHTAQGTSYALSNWKAQLLFVELNYFYYLGGVEEFGGKKNVSPKPLVYCLWVLTLPLNSVFSYILRNISRHLISNILLALFSLKLFLRGTKANCAFPRRRKPVEAPTGPFLRVEDCNLLLRHSIWGCAHRGGSHRTVRVVEPERRIIYRVR